MERIAYPAVIVVEGTSDKILLESFIDTEIVTTNGSDVPRETILYLQELSKNRDIVVLTDPDSPGKRIRDVLDKEIPGLLHAYIPKEKAIKGHKVGVAESDKETILEALNHLSPSPSRAIEGSISYSDLVELGLVGDENASKKRNEIGQKLHIGFGNGKTFLKRVNALGISKEQLKEACE